MKCNKRLLFSFSLICSNSTDPSSGIPPINLLTQFKLFYEEVLALLIGNRRSYVYA
jgi:hypothetical protein